MVVRSTHVSGRVPNLADRNLPVIHGEVGKIVLKNRSAWRRLLILGAGSSLSEQSESCGKGIATSCHDNDISSGSAWKIAEENGDVPGGCP